MKKNIKKILCVTILGAASVLNAAFQEISLNGEWDFTFQKKKTDNKSSLEEKVLCKKIPALPEESAYDIKINVPDYICFNADRFAKAQWGNKNWTKRVTLWGIAFYKKTIRIPEEWHGKSIQFYIGRALEQSYIYVNGKFVASYPYNFLVPFKTDLSKELKYGEINEIVIAVDNSKKLGTVPPRYGGIVSNVSFLISNGAGRIDDAYVRTGTTLSDIVLNVNLSSIDMDKSIDASEINWKIKEWNQPEVLEKGRQTVNKIKGRMPVSWEIKSNKIKPWSPDAPNLYTVEITWKKDNKIIDSLIQRFGVRKWTTECRRLKLNGKSIYLRQYYYYPAVSHARFPQDKKYWLAFFQLIKERGYNSVDWERETASQECLKAADESGIIVQTGTNLRWTPWHLETFPEFNISEVWPDVTMWTRIYPSMSIYTLGGELNYYDNFIKDVKRISDIVKKNNPNSLLLPSQAMRGIEYCFRRVDQSELTLKPFLHHSKRLAEITKYSDIFGNYPRGAFSYYPFSVPWNVVNEWLTIYKHPLISHEVQESKAAEYAFPYPESGKFVDLRGGIFETEYFCRMYGAIDPKRSAKSNSYYESINQVHAALTKYVFEKLRKCDNIAGYQDLGCNAGVNILFENSPGYTPESMQRYNNDNVLLLDFDNHNCLNRCYWEKDSFTASVMISLFAGKDIPLGELSWELKDGERVLARNCSTIKMLKDGTVKKLEDISFNWPEVKETRKLNLKITFIGFGVRISNDWNFWVFKKNPPPDVKAACRHNVYLDLKKRYPLLTYLKKDSPEKLWITDELTGNAIDHLEKGGDVLLLGYKPFPMNNEWPTFNPGYRINHTSGTVVYKHPAFENIPNEGWGDWNFYPLLEAAPTVVFRDDRASSYGVKKVFHDPKTPLMKDVAFKPILESVHLWGQADFANIFELKAGKGRLFVSTCITDLNNPVCRALLDSILKYVTGNGFKPTVQIEISRLRKLLEGSMPVIKDNTVFFSVNNFTGGSFYTKYASFDCAPRDAVAIFPETKTKVVFELDDENIPKTSSSELILTVDGQDSDKPGEVKISIFLNDKSIYTGPVKCIKKGWSLWNIPFKKRLLKKGVNTLEFKNLENLGGQWFMIAGARIGSSDIFKQKAEGAKDTTPPVIQLIAKPSLVQGGHESVGTIQTVFTIVAEDNESGVANIEISIDKKPFKAYRGPFNLEKGPHSVSCRCTDNAGNQTNIMKGVTEEGNDAEVLDIQIR